MASSKRQLIPFWLPCGSLFTIYLLTLAPDLTWQHWGSDGPELVAAVATLGIPHPPGYPTYVLLGKIVTLLPLSSVAYRLNLFSAICVAAAGGFVALTVQQLSQTRLTAVIAGLTFGLMPLVWSQAVVSEVYGLNLLCLAMLLWALVGQQWPPGRVGVLAGLCLTTHLSSLLILPLTFYRTPSKGWLWLMGGLLLGLGPLLALPLLAQGGSPLIWGRPDSPAGFWWLISGQIYRANVFALPARQWLERLQDWLPLLSAQLAGLGWLGLWPGRKVCQTAGFGATICLYAIYSFGYNTGDAQLFFLPGLLLLSILLAEGLKRSGRVALILPLALLMLNFDQQNLHHDYQPRTIGQTILQAAPTNAILLTADEPVTFTLWYLQFVEDQRPDTILVNNNLFAFDWYRARLGQQDQTLKQLMADNLAAFRTDNGLSRPVCDIEPVTYHLNCQP